MVRFLVQRIVSSATVLLAVTLLAFALVHLSGDPLDGFTPPGAPESVRAELRSRLGLSEPLPRQYARFVTRAVQGDFGESWRNQRPALAVVLDRLPATLALAGTALGLAILAGGTAGIFAQRARHRLARGALDSLMALGQAVPSFWLGTVLILVFAVRLGWLPSSGGPGLAELLLPALALSVMPAAVIARLLRTELESVLGEEVVRTARAKGLRERTVLLVHALRLSILPALAYLGLQLGFLVSGAVVVEGLFAYPGLGLLAINAAADRDLPVIQATVVVSAVAIILVNLLVDLLARLLDPRLATEAGR